MKAIFKDYLFNHGILVNEAVEKDSNAFETRFALAKLFNIRITDGENLVTADMIHYAEEQLGQNVPEPFYRGFPESVRKLTSKQRLFDQLLHYVHTYGMGDFSEQGHSMLEDFIQREAFNEKCEVRDFSVITEEAAAAKLEKLMQKRDELRSKELMEAFARSERSFEEVMRFLSGNEVDDE